MDLLSIKEFLDDIARLQAANGLHILLYSTCCVTLAIQVVPILPEDVNQALRVNLLVFGNLDGNIIEILLEKHAQFHLGVFLLQLVDSPVLRLRNTNPLESTIYLRYHENGAPLCNNPHNGFDGSREGNKLVLDVKYSHCCLFISLLRYNSEVTAVP